MTKMKKLVSLLLGVVMAMGMMVPAWASEMDRNIDGYTMNDIRQIILDYNEQYQWFDKIDSQEFLDFALEESIKCTDKNLKQCDELSLIQVYFAHYINEVTYNENVAFYEVNESFLKTTIGDIKDHVARENTYNINTIGVSFNYDVSSAVAYARRYAKEANIAYPYYLTGDCTNFASQCLVAGNIPMDKRPNNQETYDSKDYWYCTMVDGTRYKSTAWMRVTDFNSYWGAKISKATYKDLKSMGIVNVANAGDIILLTNSTTGEPYHAIIITSRSNGDLLYCGHTKARYDASFKNNVDSSNGAILYRFSIY